MSTPEGPGPDVDGPAAPPRDNGELVFAAPWESRAFGMALALADRGAFTWDDFRARLVARLADGPHDYYRSWLDALEDVLTATRALDRDAVDDRAALLAARPSGHDH